MRSLLALSAAAACAVVHPTSAFTCSSASLVAHTPASLVLHARPTAEALSPSLETREEATSPPETSPAALGRERLRRAVLRTWERMDTLKAAGFYDHGPAPLQAGFKSSCGMLAGALLFKWYRARFINKIPIWDRQPQWNMVVTSPEQEKELHAYSCKQCGSTIFIARHREWFFQGGNTKCTNCGATGEENFEDIRAEVIDSIDDDYFDYESPLDFVSAAERRKLVKQAGGDEEKAKQIAIDNVMKTDKTQISKEKGGESAASSSTAAASSSSKAAAAPKKKKKPKKESDDLFDELDMDL